MQIAALAMVRGLLASAAWRGWAKKGAEGTQHTRDREEQRKGDCTQYLGPVEELFTGNLLHMQGLINLHSNESASHRAVTACICYCCAALGMTVLVSWVLLLYRSLSTAIQYGVGGLVPYLMHSKHAHAALP